MAVEYLATNLGLNSRRVDASVGQQGRWGLSLGYAETPHRIAGAALLVLANKQDCSGALPLARIRDALCLEQGSSIPGTQHRWAVFGCSAVSGKNMRDSLEWLVACLQ